MNIAEKNAENIKRVQKFFKRKFFSFLITLGRGAPQQFLFVHRLDLALPGAWEAVVVILKTPSAVLAEADSQSHQRGCP